MQTRKQVIIKADSLAEAYAMAFDEIGSEFDVLEIKKVSSGAFGATNIEIKVASVEKKPDVVKEVVLNKLEPKKTIKEDLKSTAAVSVSTQLSQKNKNDVLNLTMVSKKETGLKAEKEQKSTKPIEGVSWVEVVQSLRGLGFKEDLIVKLLSEIKTTGKHLKLSPYSLVEDRLVYYCVNEVSQSKQINVLFAESKVQSSNGVSAYLFSHYSKQSLSAKKVLLTNSSYSLKSILSDEFLSVLKADIIELDSSQDWLSFSSEILSQEEVCCIFFREGESVEPKVPDAMGSVKYTKLMKWSDDLSLEEVNFLKSKKAQFLITGSEENTVGSLLKPSLSFEIPTSFVLKGKDFLTGLIHSSDLVREAIQEISEKSAVKEQKAG